MIRPDVAKWEQTTDDLRRLATESAHVRTRERFLALYTIALGQSNATLWAQQIQRCDECVMAWVHKYNERGPDAMTYRRTGGSAPFCDPSRRANRRNHPAKRAEHLRQPGSRMDAEKASAVGGRKGEKGGVAIDVTRHAARGGFELEAVQKAPRQTQSR